MRHYKMSKVFVLFVCFHFSAIQYLYLLAIIEPNKIEPKHLCFNKGSTAEPTKHKMELPTK